jgi:phage terminase large subunit-like protein
MTQQSINSSIYALPPSQRALWYAREVVAGRIPNGKYVVLACQRFLNDLERSKSEGFPYRWDKGLANYAVGFMEKMPHVKGKWAREGRRLIFEAWQCFIECNVLGWVHKETGLRRFRKAYEEIPRKNGKSIRMAARGLYMMLADGEPGAEVYSGATTEKQAHEVFKPAWVMVQRLPDLQRDMDVEQSGTVKNPGTIYRETDMSKFEPMIGKPGDGASPHCSIVDEYHEHTDDDMVESQQTGMGAREQPLLSIITTAGVNLSGPCYEQRKDVIKILEGTVEDETIFGIIYGLDEDDDWDTEEALKKANPNYGISVFPAFLLAQLKEARRSATKQNAYRTKHLNQWVGARKAWMNMLVWQKQKLAFTIEEMRKYRCWMALDLASKKDLAALILLFQADSGHFYVTGKFYVPESALEENDKYKEFHTAGHLIATPGSATDYEYIEEDIKALASMLQLQDIACDDWQANYLITRLQKDNLPVVNYNQTVKNMSEPMKHCEALLLSDGMSHDGNPVLTYCIGNISARSDAKDNVYPRKENENDPLCKIDGGVAMIMAMGRAMVAEPPREKFQMMVI